MFDHDPPKEKAPVDSTGLKIVGILAPVFFLITFLRDADAGLAVCIVLGMVMLAIKIRWRLRKHLWFWVVIGFILALHAPLILRFQVPQGNTPTLFYTMPLGIVDFLIISGALGIAEKLFLKNASADEDD
ncbi:MAG TPA: hypothetical protein VKV39_00985 [Candidatus Sulfotelmatobacter sp.]|nr:hypothetical protein [Candidatus Sulfotelmatobacter sp.]